MAILFNLEDKEALGPNIAVASILLLYAGIINMVIIIPYKIIINKKTTDIEN
jgi:flagellar motor component MotA